MGEQKVWGCRVADSKIEWTDATWNPIGGCSIASPGCIHCYAQALAGTRLAQHPLYAGTTSPSKTGPVFNGTMTVAPDDAAVWTWPLRWRGSKTPWRGPGARSMIFVGDMSDLFHANRPRAVIDKVFAVMALAQQHDFQVLTKRPDIMADYCNDPETPGRVQYLALSARESTFDQTYLTSPRPWPLPNVWKGTSIERQPEVDERVPHLLRCKAAVRFLSGEPLLGPVDLFRVRCPYTGDLVFNALSSKEGVGLKTNAGVNRIDWVIAGNESGPRRRPGDLAWMRSIRDRCAAAGVAFFGKQDDKIHPLPPDLMVRQWPMAAR